MRPHGLYQCQHAWPRPGDPVTYRRRRRTLRLVMHQLVHTAAGLMLGIAVPPSHANQADAHYVTDRIEFFQKGW